MGYDIISKSNVIFFLLFLITTLWLIFTLISKREILTRRRRNILVAWAGAQILVMVVMIALYIYAFWPALPSIASQRETVVDQFFTSLIKGKQAEAMALVARSDETDINELLLTLSDPANQTVSWEFKIIDENNYVIRQTVLANGEELGIFLELTWERFEKRWMITRIESGDPIYMLLLHLEA